MQGYSKYEASPSSTDTCVQSALVARLPNLGRGGKKPQFRIWLNGVWQSTLVARLPNTCGG